MAFVCLRLDDVHGGTPLGLLRVPEQRVWSGRAVTLAVIPFPARGCLGAQGMGRELPGWPRRSLVSCGLADYLEVLSGQGLAEIGVHGLTHADHRLAGGGAGAELVSPSPARVEWLLRVLGDFRDRFGGQTLVPPHNFLDAGVEKRCAAAGFHVSRAVMDDEVARLGLDPGSPAARAEAKRRRPWYHAGEALVVYQTAAVSADTVSRRMISPEDLAAEVMSLVVTAGVGVVTFHWWDFVNGHGRLSALFADFAAEFLAGCERLGADGFLTLPALARELSGW
jgi:hypothetical protein